MGFFDRIDAPVPEVVQKANPHKLTNGQFATGKHVNYRNSVYKALEKGEGPPHIQETHREMNKAFNHANEMRGKKAKQEEIEKADGLVAERTMKLNKQIEEHANSMCGTP